jgi:hypothetical protein
MNVVRIVLKFIFNNITSTIQSIEYDAIVDMGIRFFTSFNTILGHCHCHRYI